jgi:hypothetical protein
MCQVISCLLYCLMIINLLREVLNQVLGHHRQNSKERTDEEWIQNDCEFLISANSPTVVLKQEDLSAWFSSFWRSLASFLWAVFCCSAYKHDLNFKESGQCEWHAVLLSGFYSDPRMLCAVSFLSRSIINAGLRFWKFLSHSTSGPIFHAMKIIWWLSTVPSLLSCFFCCRNTWR